MAQDDGGEHGCKDLMQNHVFDAKIMRESIISTPYGVQNGLNGCEYLAESPQMDLHSIL